MSVTECLVTTPNDGEPTVKPYLVECKFTVERREELGTATSEKRITFDGYATDALYAALMDSIKEVLYDRD